RAFHVTGVQTCALPISGGSDRHVETAAEQRIDGSLNRDACAGCNGEQRPEESSHVGGLLKKGKEKPRPPGRARSKSKVFYQAAKIGRASCRERLDVPVE